MNTLDTFLIGNERIGPKDFFCCL
uniref:Uncharacterized protein n=1 Tax=Anguilla anguilla TaxID=7936 RepID=A0A0E9VR24_ANGAN